MPYTPVELKHVRVPRRLLGYHRAAVRELLTEVAASFEGVWRERAELADRLEANEKELTELRERERALSQTLVVAEQAASDLREQARREAELIVAEAHNEARSVTRAAQGERQRLQAEARRVASLLRAALGMVEESATEGPETAVGERPAGWPERDDTREFERPAEAQPQLRRVSGGFDALP